MKTDIILESALHLNPAEKDKLKALIQAGIEGKQTCEDILFLLGAQKLDADAIAKLSENIQAMMDVDAAAILKGIDIEKRAIRRTYLAESDKDIAKFVKENKPNKTNWKWSRGLGSSPLKPEKDKIDKTMFRWNRHGSLAGRVNESTGEHCHFWLAKDKKWYFALGRNAYGPFQTEEEAEAYLKSNHANPGGYTVDKSGTKSAPRNPKKETSNRGAIPWSIRRRIR